jgi:peroxiredoxin
VDTLVDPISPDDIDLEFVARPVPGLEVATIGHEQIVIGGTTQLVVLNPSAALIFQFLDGEATLGELVDDFTETLGFDRGMVEADVLAFARELGAKGLLEGVALPQPEIPDGLAFNWEQPEAVEVGESIDDFTLDDLDGNRRSLSDFRGRRVLLVNWNPGCGFCVMIASELAALDPLLAERDVRLLLVTRGDADANRALHDEHGLTAPTFLRSDAGVDPFRGTGTPAAYLIDADGALAEAMVVGADQVPMLARDLAGVDPATPYGAAAIDDPADEGGSEGDEVRGNYLAAPGAMCGPGAGGGTSNSTGWQGTRVYALGGYHVGIRYDDAGTAAVLDRLFDGARVSVRRAPDNYSVALGATRRTNAAGASQSLKLLVHGSAQLVRSRSRSRVLAGLLQYLSADLEPADPTLTRVNATAMVHNGEALLLPPRLVDSIKQLQPRLTKAGLCIVDTPRTLLDPTSSELVVPEPSIAHDESLLVELDRDVQLGNELRWVRPGRYRVTTWFLRRGAEHIGPLTPAVAVTAALPLLFELDDLRPRVESLAALFADITPYAIWYQSVNELVDQVSAALDAS